MVKKTFTVEFRLLFVYHSLLSQKNQKENRGLSPRCFDSLCQKKLGKKKSKLLNVTSELVKVFLPQIKSLKTWKSKRALSWNLKITVFAVRSVASKLVNQLRKKVVAPQKKVGQKTREGQGYKSQGSSSSLVSQEDKVRVSSVCHSPTIVSLLLPFNSMAKSSQQLLCSCKFRKVGKRVKRSCWILHSNLWAGAQTNCSRFYREENPHTRPNHGKRFSPNLHLLRPPKSVCFSTWIRGGPGCFSWGAHSTT